VASLSEVIDLTRSSLCFCRKNLAISISIQNRFMHEYGRSVDVRTKRRCFGIEECSQIVFTELPLFTLNTSFASLAPAANLHVP